MREQVGKLKYTLGVYSIFITEVPVNRQRHPGRLSLQSTGFFAAPQALTSERALMDAQRVCLFWRTWEHQLSLLCSTSTTQPAHITPKNLVMIFSTRGPWKLTQPSWPHCPWEVVLNRESWSSASSYVNNLESSEIEAGVHGSIACYTQLSCNKSLEQ